MIGDKELTEMIFPKWLRIAIVFILTLAIIGGIDVVGKIIQFITK